MEAHPQSDTPQPAAPESGRPVGDHDLFKLPPHVHNFFLECARCATEGGEPAYYRWIREQNQRRAKPTSVSSDASQEAPRA